MRWISLLMMLGCSGFENQKMAVPPSMMVGGLVLPVGVAVNDRYVYWLEFGPQNQGLCGMLSRMEKSAACDAGCADVLTNMRFLVISLGLGSDDVCWLEFYDAMREIHCMSIASGQIRKLADNLPYAFNLFSDGSSLFWANGGKTGAVQTTVIAQGGVTTLASGLDTPVNVSADAEGLYWTDTAGLHAASRDGTNARVVAAGLDSASLVKPEGDWLYFAEKGKVERIKKDGSGLMLIANPQTPYDLAVDSAGVYWLDQGTPPNYVDGQVMRADLDGKHARTVADHQPYLSAMTVDADTIYWVYEGTGAANYLDGALWRAPKTN
jgi:hypothetical protein